MAISQRYPIVIYALIIVLGSVAFKLIQIETVSLLLKILGLILIVIFIFTAAMSEALQGS